MDYIKAKEYVEKGNGIITSKEFNENNITKYCINNLIKNGVINRYGRGIYVRTDIFEDEYYILQKRNSNLIFSYGTALYFQNETEKIPDCMDITVYKGYNVQRLPNDIRVHYTSRKTLFLGAIKMKTPNGFEITAYNLERTLCDIIKSRNTGMDKEQSNKFIREMFLKNKIDSNMLMKYAKELRCLKKVEKIMEVLT